MEPGLTVAHVPWNVRRRALGWRGSATGRGQSTNHRLAIVAALRAAAASCSVELDVFFNDVNEIASVVPPGLLGAKLIFEEFSQYRFLLDMGGNSYSRRLTYLAQLNATLIVFNTFADLSTLVLLPDVHYHAPFAVGDVCGLLSAIDDNNARVMGRRAGDVMRRAMTISNLVAYTKGLLEHLDLHCTFV